MPKKPDKPPVFWLNWIAHSIAVIVLGVFYTIYPNSFIILGVMVLFFLMGRALAIYSDSKIFTDIYNLYGDKFWELIKKLFKI